MYFVRSHSKNMLMDKIDQWKQGSSFVEHKLLQFSSVQWLSRVRLFVTPWIAAHQASLPITNSQSSLRLMSIELVMPSSHLILCRPLLLLPPIPPSIRVFSNESTLRMRWPKYWTFSFSIILSKEIPGLISFRTDWLDFLAVQGSLKSLPLLHSSKVAWLYWLHLEIYFLPVFFLYFGAFDFGLFGVFGFYRVSSSRL